MSDLRQRLIDAKLAGRRAKMPEEHGYKYRFRSNEQAADLALAVFVEELRERADAMRVVGDGNRAAELVAKWLDETADEIAPKGQASE